jgi:Zn-dependent protease/predicted transcriptional regulator
MSSQVDSPFSFGRVPPAPRDRVSASKPMRTSWSFRLGRVRGIDIYVHGTLLILLAWIGLSHALNGHGMAATAEGVLFTATIFGIVVLHELGHALTAARYGIRTRDITLYPIGGVATLERIPENPRQEFAVALAGPAVNIALAAALAAVLVVAKMPSGVENVQLIGGSFLAKLMWVNVSLALFNLLPAFPMDGGRVLRALLAFRMGRDRATEIAARVGQAMALGFGLLGLFGNPMLLFIALFVWAGAQGEASLVRFRALMHDVSVRQAMTRESEVLDPSTPLSDVIDAIVTRGHHAFPVVRHGRVIGVVTKNSVLEALAEVGPDSGVLAAMDDRFELADPSEMLESALARLEAKGGKALIVAKDGALLGVVTPQSVGELLTMRQAAQHRLADIRPEQPREGPW